MRQGGGKSRMPRGVAIPEVRERLFQAAERVLLGRGADGFSSRAVAQEAGVARGLLFNHFTDLDQFLAELVVDRAHAAGREAAQLISYAGSGDVAANLAGVATALLRSPLFAIIGIVHSRPSTLARLHELGSGSSVHVLGDVEKAFVDYLEAAKAGGRIAADTNTGAVALALVGSLHYGFVTGRIDQANATEYVPMIIGTCLRSEPADESGR
jgi:AcrR family transcriptional regulator